MEGILIVDKPQGFTSFDVVAKMRGICNTRKIGHGGTLDPMATGVLPVFIGSAAKAVDMQTRQDKTYEAVLRFGIATDTGDITGAVLEQRDGAEVSQQQLAEVLPRFLGEQQQLPPMYSAVKLNGKPLYRYAREGVEVERKLRTITIHSIEQLPAPPEASQEAAIRVHCSKGTYIRTLAEDIGKALGLPATLAALRRTQAGVFGIAQAHTLEELQAARDEDRLAALVRSVETVFAELPELELDPVAASRLQNGAPVYGCKQPPGRYRVRLEGRFLGLAQVLQDGQLRTEKLFVNRQ